MCITRVFTCSLDALGKRCIQTFDCECASLIPNRESMQLQQQLTDVNKQPFHEPSTHVDWKSKSGAVTGLGTRPAVDSAHFRCSQISFNPRPSVGRPVPPSPPQSQSVHQPPAPLEPQERLRCRKLKQANLLGSASPT